MTSDMYTKCVLTVIAVALVLLCIENAIQPRSVSAQGLVKLAVSPADRPLPVQIMGSGVNYGMVSVGKDNPLAVSVVSPQ